MSEIAVPASAEEMILRQQSEFETMRKQVAEMHAMMTQVSIVLRQMESHPMLSAFMPRLG